METKAEKKENIPEELRGEGTKVVSFKKMIEDRLIQIKDLATMEVLLPVDARLRERMASIKKMGSAKHIKIRGHFKTTPPTMHITKLIGKKLGPNEAEITFSVFEANPDGSKKMHEQQTEIIKEDGSKINRTTSAEFRIAYEVTETIKTGKPITREVVKFELQ